MGEGAVASVFLHASAFETLLCRYVTYATSFLKPQAESTGRSA
jgi:hypothetical protein